MAPENAPPDSVGFLLSQLGAYAAGEFAAALRPHELTPPQAGMLRLVASRSGLSQQALAARLGMAPSRVVAFVDELEDRGLLRRERDRTDRRVNVLVVTGAGAAALRSIADVARAHDGAVTAGLGDAEREQLRALLVKLIDARGLTPGVHPGFGALGGC